MKDEIKLIKYIPNGQTQSINIFDIIAIDKNQGITYPTTTGNTIIH